MAYLMPDVSTDRFALQPLPEHLPSEYNFGVEETSHYPHNATLAGKVAQQPVY